VLGWNRIRSDLYDVRRSGSGFVFDGKGAGHGIGLCQDGAAAMGEMGRTYREILAFYYPNTSIDNGTASPRVVSWVKVSSERADFETARPSQEPALAAVADRLIVALESATGRRFDVRPLIRVYPTIEAFRDDVGEPGWVAASTRGRVIRMQPVASLRERGVLESTLRHELAHVLIDSRAPSTLPLWFREGLVLWLTEPRGNPASTAVDLDALSRTLEHPQSEQELRRSYQAALGTLERLVRAHGRETVLSWIERGVPRAL
jgi:stage II sporulation protein D